MLFWGLFVLLSLLTHSQSDPSLNHVVSGSVAVNNSAGLFGAFVSGLLVDIFGFAAFVWPLFFIAWGLGCVTTLVRLPWWRWLGFLLLATCLLSLGTAWHLGFGDVRGGGVLGRVLHGWGTRLLSPAGSSLLWLFVLFIALELCFGIPWLELIRKATAWLQARAETYRFTPAQIRERLQDVLPSGGFRGLPKLSLPGGKTRIEEDKPLPDLIIDLDLPMTNEGPEEPAAPVPDMFGRLPEAPVPSAAPLEEVHASPVNGGPLLDVAEAIRPDASPDEWPDARPDVRKDARQDTWTGTPEADVPPLDAAGSLEETVSPGPETAPGGFVFREGPIATVSYADDENFDFEDAPLTGPGAGVGSPPAARTDFLDIAEISDWGDALPLGYPETAPSMPQPVSPVASMDAPRAGDGTGIPFDPAASEPVEQYSARDLALVEAEDLSYRPAWAGGETATSAMAEERGSSAPSAVSGHSMVLNPPAVQVSSSSSPSFYDAAPQPDISPQTAPFTAPQPDGAHEPHADWFAPAASAAPGSASGSHPGAVPPAPAPLRRKVRPVLPNLDLLGEPEVIPGAPPSRDVLAAKGERLMACLADFGIQGEMAYITPGPVISMFEIRPAPGVKVSRILNLSDDLALVLKALAVRIQAPVPGSDTVGVEIPNEVRAIVNFRELLQDQTFNDAGASLNMALGKDIGGHPFAADLARMPHLLVAGATGAGKSVCLNSILLSFLYRCTPDDLRLLLVDPKRIELAVYADLPHLVHPVVTEVELAKNALAWAVSEMDARYDALARMGVRNIAGYNKKIEEFGDNPPPGFEDLQHLPFLVIIIDELADLMMTAGKEIEGHIVRLAQLARAAGIHLIVATQRPSVDVVTGLIKANFPCRISFQVSSKHDSRTILDTVGAEHLLGKGDMLYKPSGGKLQRLHGAFVSDEEVVAVVDYWKHQQAPDYAIDFSEWGNEGANGQIIMPGGPEPNGEDALYGEVINFVREQGKVSISLIQRRFRIGFNKAARFVEQMEQDGIIQPGDRQNKARQVVRD